MMSNISDNIKIAINPYNDECSENRKGIIVKGSWSNNITDFIEKHSIRAVYLNIAHGWTGEDFSFLFDLDMIEELNIITSKAENISAIEGMDNLIELSLTCVTTNSINFAKLNKLKRCYLYWWPGASGIFDVISLTSLHLDNARFKDISSVEKLKNLKSLTIANSDIESIESISRIYSLNELSLLNCKKVKDFMPLFKLSELKRLTIDGCKNLNNLNFLNNLYNIEVLNISDNNEIESLQPLSYLSNLKAFAFAGTTKIEDGNLEVLETLPKLSMLMFAQRKNYSHKLIKEWNWENYNYPDKLLKRVKSE